MSHDARLILETNCELYECASKLGAVGGEEMERVVCPDASPIAATAKIATASNLAATLTSTAKWCSPDSKTRTLWKWKGVAWWTPPRRQSNKSLPKPKQCCSFRCRQQSVSPLNPMWLQ